MDQRARIRAGLGLITLACVGVAGWGIARARASRQFFEPANLLSRFPLEGGTALNVDFASLRKAGLLESKAPPEPEYKQFVEAAGVDYRRDVDLLVASFSKSGNYFIARGRFDWKKLREYAVRQGGSCYQDLCRVQGSTPERRISFLPLRGDTIGLAVSGNDLAASRLTKTGPTVVTRPPEAPVWVSIPGSALRDSTVIPVGMRVFLTALSRAERIVITAAQGNGGIQAHMEATCRTSSDAAVLASQLRSTTGILRDTLMTDKEASRDELARTLAAGTFDNSGARVTGAWPIAKGLIESLTAGI
ncbi:MAG TPA: hypothetical protein VKB79_04075 [Bryobacteraceae bacterium]|nr:hypothetical protein [Bryobacteraceae bacterium]